MKRSVWLSSALVLALGITVQAAETPLGQVSKDADVVIRIRAFDRTVKNVAALANEIQPGAGDLVSQNATMFGLVLSNPALAGVDQTKDFYLVLFARPEGEPKALFVIPTTDGPALQKALPENYDSQVREDWVFYATKEHGVPEAVTEADSMESVIVRSEALEMLEESDIGLYVNVKHLAEVYADKIQAGRQKFEEQIQQGLKTPGVENAAGAVQILKLEADIAFQLLEDTDSIAIGINASKDGLEIADHLDFEEGSQVATFLEKHPTSKFKSLSKLGEGFPVYFGVSADFKSLAEMSGKILDAIYTDPAVQGALQESLKTLYETPVTSAVGSFDVASGGTGLLRTTGFYETKAAAELLDGARKMAAAMKSVKAAGVTSETQLKAEAETIGARKIDVMTVKQQVDPKQPGAAIQAMISGVMFGPNGLESRSTALADGFLQVQGGGKGAMEAALKAYDASENSLSDEREGLAEEAHALLLLDLPGLVSNGLLAATSIPAIPLPIKKEAVEELQITRSYTAVSAVAEKHSLRFDVIVPTEQFRGVMKLVGLFQQLQGGGK